MPDQELVESLHLIAGLGNPGEDYVRTRHNAGFRLVELLASRWRSSWAYERKFNARLARGEFAGKRCLLCEPLSYMNASGEVIQSVMNYFQLLPGQLFVAVDDADISLGEIRMRPQGGSGGHHGLESIFACIGTKEFVRQRLGIGRKVEGQRQITGHVLGQFSREENRLFEKVLDRAADQVEAWLAHGSQKAMNQFNGVINSADEE